MKYQFIGITFDYHLVKFSSYESLCLINLLCIRNFLKIIGPNGFVKMSEIVSADVIYLKSIVLYRLHMVLLLLLHF